MLDEFKENMLYQIFLDADDFFQEWDNYLQQRGLQDKPVRYVPRPRLTISEMVTILIFFITLGINVSNIIMRIWFKRSCLLIFPAWSLIIALLNY